MKTKKAAQTPKKAGSAAQKSIGVTGVRRPVRAQAKRLVGGITAADASPLFGAGGAAFALWVEQTKQIDPRERRTEAEWAPLIREFAARPIHGYRRKSVNDNHKLIRR